MFTQPPRPHLSPLSRSRQFCERFGLTLPILVAPMAGACPTSLSVAVAKVGGMGAMGALVSSPDGIKDWVAEFRAGSTGAFQLNTWIPDPAPARDTDHEARLRTFLAGWGPEVPPSAGDLVLPDFGSQCAAFLEARPPVVSSIMGLFPAKFVRQLKDAGIAWFATATTLHEAKLAESAGADAIIAQGFEAGGHRGTFDPAAAERQAVGLFALLPRLADHIELPLIAAGGIADSRGIAAALNLGAHAVTMGTAFLRCPEAKTHLAWAAALEGLEPENTMPARVLSGRLARSIATEYVLAATDRTAPIPAPFPVQRGLTALMKDAGAAANDYHRMAAWAGQSAALARAVPAGRLVQDLWSGAQRLLAPTA